MRIGILEVFLTIGLALGASSAGAQTPAPPAPAPPPPPKTWQVGASAGLTLTSGNTDTSSLNLAYDLTYDPQTGNVVKSDGLVLRGENQGVISADSVTLNARDEYKLNGHLAVVGSNQYVRDTFKGIDHLDAPTGGLTYTFADTKTTQAEAEGGVGAVWEQDVNLPSSTSGAVTFDQKVTRALTTTTTVSEAVTALWKTKDFSDALYSATASIAASMSTHTQLKLEVLDTFKNKPPAVGLKKNDVTLIVAFVYKR